MMISALVLLPQYFSRHRALAVSIGTAGFSVGGLTFGPLTTMLLNMYGVRGTLLIIAGIFCQLCVFACLFRPAPGIQCHGDTTGKTKLASIAGDKEDIMLTIDNTEPNASSKLQHENKLATENSNAIENNNNHRSRSRVASLLGWFRHLFADLFDVSLLRSVPFQLFLFTAFCLFVGLSSLLQHMPSRAAHFGVEPWHVSVLPTLICTATIISRLVFGFVANLSCTCLVLQLAVTLTLSGLLQTTMWLATTFETMALFCVLIGSTNGQ